MGGEGMFRGRLRRDGQQQGGPWDGTSTICWTWAGVPVALCMRTHFHDKASAVGGCLGAKQLPQS